jgi:hypothetical protein
VAERTTLPTPARGGPAWRILPLGAAFAFAVLAGHAAWVETPTIDEFAHLPAGFAYLEHGAFGLYTKNPPLYKMVMAMASTGVDDVAVPTPVGLAHFAQGWGPWNYAADFMDANRDNYFAIFFRARLVVIATALAMAALLYAWARELFGERAAAISTALVLLSPSLLAHGHLATLDVACATFALASVYSLRWAMKAPVDDGATSRATWRIALAGAVFGVALLVKFTALLLAPALLLLVAWKRRATPGRGAAEIATLFAVAILVLNLGMGGKNSFASLGDQDFRSGFAQEIQAVLPAWTPMPLPLDYVLGFDVVKRDSEQGELGSYLMGRWTQRGVWYHDLVAFAVKTPLPLLAMLAVCPFALSRALRSGGLTRSELPWLLAPLATLGLGLVVFNQVKIGVRYLLPLEPFLWLLAASLWSVSDGRAIRAAAATAIAWYAACAWSVHPNYLSFFNVAAGGAANGHRYLVGSDLDWGQDLYRLPDALAARGHTGPIWLHYFGHVDPKLYGLEYQLLPDHPVKGLVAVSVSFLHQQSYPVTAPTGERVARGWARLGWLHDRTPVARLGSIWLYDTR